ncbi:hypothetical protein LTS15_004667 [Exophiala xenobiotica]|nr:hypothetical protein LTS15_004667 [Exophiala xenobiotica]
MSAGQYGARLLDEVQEESLEQLLAEIRHTTNPWPKGVLGFPQLDALLEALRYPAQPAAEERERPELQSSTAQSPAPDDHDPHQADHDGDDDSPLRRRHELYQHKHNAKPKPAAIEITSRKSSSGKTTLCYHLAALSSLPKSHGGRESMVIYIDTDGRFSATRLFQILVHYLSSHNHTNNDILPGTTSTLSQDAAVQATAREAMNHILTFRPQSSSQLLSLLDSLPTFLLDRTRHSSIYRPLGLIILDPTTSFYWQDRFDRDMARLQSKSPGLGLGLVDSASPLPSRTARIIERLKALQARFECAVVFSTTAPPPASTTSHAPPPQVQGQEQMQMQTHITPSAPHQGPGISPWTAYATLTMTLSRTRAPQFAPQMSMDECVRDAEKRFDAVKNARFVASVELKPGQSSRGKATAEGTGTSAGRGAGGRQQAGDGAGGFGFKIGEGGVDVDVDVDSD